MVSVYLGSKCIAQVVPNRVRRDVADHFGGHENAILSGFGAQYELPRELERCELVVTGCEINDQSEKVGVVTELARRTVMNWIRIFHSFETQETRQQEYFSPFPKGLEPAIRTIWPETKIAADGTADQASLTEKLISLSEASKHSVAPSIVIDYLKFLTKLKAHFSFVHKYFPAVNKDKAMDDKDYNTIPNSPREMLSIANHLYVLKSYGVVGSFAEFGCFKGFSSSMLSYACELLDIDMHIFDSFEGLPESESSYYKAGDFCGTLEEVKRNVFTYGSVGKVTWHKGFFKNSLPEAYNKLGTLMTIWMDVDLYSSAKDVMDVFDKLDHRGAIFSHECDGRYFSDEIINPFTGHPHSVVAAIVERSSAAKVELSGRFLFGATGAFWAKTGGVPVLKESCLTQILEAI